MRRVHLVPYDPSWPAAFEAETARLRGALGPACVTIHHVGSTSVPGLLAKPRIDMLPVVTSVASVDLSVDDVHGLLDWANRANLSELDAVCGIGPSIAQSIVSTRPMHSAAEVLAVPRIGNTTLFKILGKEGKSCSQQGSVSDEWCGQPDAQCLCNAGPGSDSFFLDEDAAFSLAEEAAGQFYLDTSDSIWEEYCQGNYDESQGYDEQEVMAVCDEYLAERFIPAAFEGALVLVGVDYGSEQAAHEAVREYVEDVFDAQVGDWAPGFPAAVDAALGD